MIVNILAALIIVFSILVSPNPQTLAPGSLTFPTEQERKEAIAAFRQGDYSKMEAYYTRLLAYFEDAMVDRFDRDKFAARQKDMGQPTDQVTIDRVYALYLSACASSRLSAADAAWWLGQLKLLHLKPGEAIPYLLKAVELDPQNSRYKSDLGKILQEIPRGSPN